MFFHIFFKMFGHSFCHTLHTCQTLASLRSTWHGFRWIKLSYLVIRDSSLGPVGNGTCVLFFFPLKMMELGGWKKHCHIISALNYAGWWHLKSAKGVCSDLRFFSMVGHKTTLVYFCCLFKPYAPSTTKHYIWKLKSKRFIDFADGVGTPKSVVWFCSKTFVMDIAWCWLGVLCSILFQSPSKRIINCERISTSGH